MPESARPDDLEFLLRGLDHTTVRLQVNPAGGIRPTPGSLEEAILAFVRAHPTTTVTAIWQGIPAAHEKTYNEVRALVLGMLEEQTLQRVGFAPLEEVDGRYERVPTCDVCGQSSAGHPILFYKHNTPVVRCTGCGLLYANPRWKGEHLTGVYGAEYWTDYAERVKHFAFDPVANRERWRFYLPVLDGVRQNGRILDVGCAQGDFLAAAKERGWAGYGLEIALIAAEYAERTHGVSVHVGSLETAPWPDGWFDAVTLWDVIEHVPSPRDYVARIARLVRPGGMFALTTPNIRSTSYALLGRDWWVVGPNSHIYYFAARPLVRLLADHGFAVHYMTTMSTEVATWERALRHPRLQRFAPRLQTWTSPLLNRFLLGDELVLFARKTSSEQRAASSEG